mgnify:CR=1 FL=1
MANRYLFHVRVGDRRATRTRSPTRSPDAILDAILRDDPYGRVACETLITTGPGRRGRARSPPATYVDIPEIARRDDPRHRLRPGRVRLRTGPPARSRSRSTSSRPTSPRASTRPSRTRAGDTDDDARHRQGAGDQGMMVGYASQRDRRADAGPDRAGPPAGAPPSRGPPARDDRLPAARRQDAGHRRVRRRPKPVRDWTPWSCPPSTRPTSTIETLLAPTIRGARDRAGPPRGPRLRGDAVFGQPDRPLRAGRPQRPTPA